MEVLIVGAGIGGLTLALMLHRAGIAARVFESAPEIAPARRGHQRPAAREQGTGTLGLEDELARVAVDTREAVFYNRFGQLIYREPLGRAAGYASPQFSIHRGDLQRRAAEEVPGATGVESDRIWDEAASAFQQDENA